MLKSITSSIINRSTINTVSKSSAATVLTINKRYTNSNNTTSTINTNKILPNPAPKYYVLQYNFITDVFDKRPPHRAAHLSLATAAITAGDLLLAGPITSTPPGALLIWKTANKSIIEQFAAADPYVTAKLVTSYTIHEWNTTVIGADIVQFKL